MGAVSEKSKSFAIKIVRLSRYLQEKKHECILSKQVLRSGTSIGANVREGTQAISRPEFISKMAIALKESVETEYWLELLHETDYLEKPEFDALYQNNKELTKLLTAILISSKKAESDQGKN